MGRDSAIRAIRAGYDLHHGLSEDPDLALLDGDRLYADGLAELAMTSAMTRTASRSPASASVASPSA